MPRTGTISLLLVACLAACETQRPSVYSSLESSTELFALHPADIAILPVEDATPDGNAKEVLDSVRAAIAEALVQRMYTPLSPAKIDEVLADAEVRSPTTSVLDAAWLGSIEGRFGEDGTLAVRITQWDTSSLMATGRVRFAADISLVSPTADAPLWSGVLKGAVKAGGLGPAPRDRTGRARSAAAEFAGELVRLLPKRRL
ncbi:MAG: hypothetical protein AAF628_13560 [Planctomycetota bacterium]